MHQVKRVVVSIVATAAALLGAILGAGVAHAGIVADTNANVGVGWATRVDAQGQTFSSSATKDVGILASFDWTANFNARLESREYSTPNAGTHRISFSAGQNCRSGETINVELFAQDFPGDDSFGSRDITCSSGGTATFTNVRADTFYFVLTSSHWGTLPNRVLNGTTVYP